MGAPVFGRDIDCPHCSEVHPAARDCRANVEVSDRVWAGKASAWRKRQPRGSYATSEDCTKAIGRPYNPKLIGAVFAEWARLGYIREVRITTARRRQRHNGTLRVWEILL